MGRVLLLVMMAACTGSSADASPDGAGDEEVRPVTGVLVTADGVRWTYGIEACSSEFGCYYGDVTALWRQAPFDGTVIIDRSPAGAMSIAGDDAGAFIVTGPSHDERYVKRLGHGALSIPRPWTQGPAVDATYVYWVEQYALRRANRTGDGSDAMTLAYMGAVAQLAVFGGYAWGFDRGGSLVRVPINGGTVEYMTTNVIAMTVAPSRLVVSRARPSGAELGSFDATGSYAVLTMLDRAASYVVADERDVVWTSSTSSDHVEYGIYRMPAGGGAIETVATGATHGYAIGITADRVLYDFTHDGFTTAPR